MNDWAKDHPDTFGGRLERLRLAANMGRPTLAKLADVSPQTLNSYATGARRDPDCDTIARLSRALDVHPSALLPSGLFKSELVAIPVKGQFPPRESEAGVIRCVAEVLGMNSGSPLYALHVVDESLAAEGIHADDYMIVCPDDAVESGIYLVNDHEAVRIARAGAYFMVAHQDGHTERVVTPPVVTGRVVCHGHWTAD